MRIFLAIDLPPAVRAGVRRVQSLLRESGADVRWVQPQAAHLTLLFFGEIGPAQLGRIETEITPLTANAPPLQLHLRGLGAFPNPRRPRVLWIGVQGDVERLRALQGALRDALASLLPSGQRQRFDPHVTFGRVRRGPPSQMLASLLLQHRDVDVGPLPVRRLRLVRSRLGGADPRYETLARYPLDGEAELPV